MLHELRGRASKKGNDLPPFTVPQLRSKFKKCISECKKVALTVKTATGVKRFQEKKVYGAWFERLFELVKTRDSCQPQLATGPSAKFTNNDEADLSDTTNEDPIKKLYVPVKEAVIKKKKKDSSELVCQTIDL